MSTPTPTLKELPPKKGSILELRSVNEDFDGKLVEFLKDDPENDGKIYVGYLDDEESKLRVKIICCRRPDIKPLELADLYGVTPEKIEDEEDNCPVFITREKRIKRKRRERAFRKRIKVKFPEDER